jgi:hypothetical protein
LSITETVLVFVGIPAAVVAAVYTLVFATAGRRGSKRYRPGRPYTFAPVWFLASEDGSGTRRPAVGAGAERPAIPGPVLAQAADAPAATHGVTGGASDSW